MKRTISYVHLNESTFLLNSGVPEEVLNNGQSYGADFQLVLTLDRDERFLNVKLKPLTERGKAAPAYKLTQLIPLTNCRTIVLEETDD